MRKAQDGAGTSRREWTLVSIAISVKTTSVTARGRPMVIEGCDVRSRGATAGDRCRSGSSPRVEIER